MLHYHYVTYLYVKSPIEGCHLVYFFQTFNTFKTDLKVHSISSLFFSLYRLVFVLVLLHSNNIIHSYTEVKTSPYVFIL